MARKKESWKDSGYVAQSLPPSKDELRQGMWTWIIIAVAAAALVGGVILRFTVFEDRFKPTPFNTPLPVMAPSPNKNGERPASPVSDR